MEPVKLHSLLILDVTTTFEVKHVSFVVRLSVNKA